MKEPVFGLNLVLVRKRLNIAVKC